jgi:hypothetical protein
MSNLARWKGFSAPDAHTSLVWLHEPARWSLVDGEQCLRLEPGAGTDFWQRTHYGFRADNGHFLYADVAGDVIITTFVRMHPVHQYDQAGLMVRLSPECGRLGAVVTNQGYSDWSTQPFSGREVWLRVRREGQDYIVDSSENGSDWEQIRMAHLAEDDGTRRVACGLYACSPKEPGFAAEFFALSFSRSPRIAAGRV